MTQNEHIAEAEQLREEQRRSGRQMRDAQASNAVVITSGEMNVDAIPGGNITPVDAVAFTDEGHAVTVTIFEASFNGETTRCIHSHEARDWFAQKRAEWTEMHGREHEQLKARARFERMQTRLSELLAQSEDYLGDDVVQLVVDSVQTLGAAIDRIGVTPINRRQGR